MQKIFDASEPASWPAVLTAPEVAQIMRLSTRTIQRYIESGLIRSLPTKGRCLIYRDEVFYFLDPTTKA